MNFFRSRLSSVRRPDGFAIRSKKGSTYYAGGFAIPYPIDMLATAWLLGIANPQSIKRLGHFLTADCKSAGTPNGGKGISGSTEGRVDCIVETPMFVYIFEFKRDGSASEALKQIEEKGYAREYATDNRTIYQIGCNFSSKTGTIDDWKSKASSNSLT